MKLSLEIKCNTKVPYEKRDSEIPKTLLNDIKMTIKTSGFNPAKYIRAEYKGTFSTKEAADNFASHLLWSIYDTGTDKVKSRGIEEIPGRCSFHYEPSDFDVVTPNCKKLSLKLESDKIHDFEGFKERLELLEKKWFIEPRKEHVTDCDYWCGFFGTSNNLWTGSIYPRANPAERAEQWAYDLEHGLRKAEGWSMWFFPGFIPHHAKPFSKEQIDVIMEINQFVKENDKLQNGIPRVIKGLRKYAAIYRAL